MLDRSVRKIIESKLYSYENIKRQAYEYRESVIHGSGSAPSVNVSGGQTSDPTASKAMRLVAGIDASKWLSVMDIVLNKFAETGKDKLIKLRYFDRATEQHACAVLYISHAAYFEWIDTILQEICILASYMRLVNPFEQSNQKNKKIL